MYLYTVASTGHSGLCSQNVQAHQTGNVFIQVSWTNGGVGVAAIQIVGNSLVNFNGSVSSIFNLGSVTAGNTYTINFGESFTDGGNGHFNITNIWVGGSSTNTPAPTYTVTTTPTPAPGTSTNTATPTLTPVPIPGAMSTNIPTATECPGGCAVAKLTAVPGMATVVTVDTSPFSPLKSLTLTRSTCAAFGYAQIPMPHIIGTPAYGSTTPLSYTWTVPITGPWDNSIVNGSIVLTNTAIEPCAMSEIPSFVWDLTYWLSVLMLAVGWFLWLIGFVGRLSGEETING